MTRLAGALIRVAIVTISVTAVAEAALLVVQRYVAIPFAVTYCFIMAVTVSTSITLMRRIPADVARSPLFGQSRSTGAK